MRALLRIILLAAAALAPAASAQELARRIAGVPPPVAAVPPAGRIPSPASVLFVGAHPDDEVLLAPLLARWCNDARARCSLLIATRGERGPCLLPDGCQPDLASVRGGEAGSSAEYFGADLILLSLPDGGGAAPPPWAPGTADAAGLTATLGAFIRAEAPEIVLTFDPRHGTTCHPDHRAIGELALDAVALLDAPPPVFLLETRVEIDTEETAFRFRPAAAGLIRFDATEPLTVTGQPAWSAIGADMERYPSQFDPAWRAATSHVPAGDRNVFLAPAAAVLTRPASTCP